MVIGRLREFSNLELEVLEIAKLLYRASVQVIF